MPVDRAERALRKLRRMFSRSEWAVRLLRLPQSAEPNTSPGLVMIQIDGLSRGELDRALGNGSMPFVGHLVKDEGYRVDSFYCGLPSTTPAIQAELFYGVRNVVPAFSFLDRASGRLVQMYEHDPAASIERELSRNEGLLREGSAYCDIYTGGAADPRFCMSSIGWGDFVRAAHPVVLPLLAVAHLPGVARALGLLLTEFVLACGGFVRGVAAGQDLATELKFVRTRVAICVLLREMITLGAEVDIARGLPVVHVNFLGYDEQAHRRGPSSRFAHRGLRGIDRAIARLTRASRRSNRRDYEVWVYSDHGQEETVSYHERFGRTVREAVAEVFRELSIETHAHEEPRLGVQTQRARLLGESLVKLLVPGIEETPPPVSEGQLAITAAGPLGHVYCPRALDAHEREVVARRLVTAASIPLVLAAAGPETAHAWTADGEFLLPRDAAEILGSDHPYLRPVTEDLVSLCHHPNAGEFIISGWARHGQKMSFPHENGAHGGPGAEETSAFVLAPGDTDFGVARPSPLRARNLRAVALRVLGRAGIRVRPRLGKRPVEQRTLRVMTYNVHSCIGMDGRLSPERIARVIARYDPDIVALQELDMGRARTGGIDQAKVIAEDLEMLFHFHPAISVEEEQYGDAVLSRHTMHLVRSGSLPQLPGRKGLEPRGALWVKVEGNGWAFHLLNTHLSLHARERGLQVEALCGREWLGHPECAWPRILCGDFNALPRSAVCRRIGLVLRDCQAEAPGHRPRGTFFSRYPLGRIDHIFVDPRVDVVSVEVPATALTRVASDHLPLIAEMTLGPASEGA